MKYFTAENIAPRIVSFPYRYIVFLIIRSIYHISDVSILLVHPQKCNVLHGSIWDLKRCQTRLFTIANTFSCYSTECFTEAKQWKTVHIYNASQVLYYEGDICFLSKRIMHLNRMSISLLAEATLMVLHILYGNGPREFLVSWKYQYCLG